MNETEHPRQRSLSDYLALAWRRKWVIIITTLVAGVGAYVLASRQTDMYRGGAEVLLSRQNISNVVTGVANPDIYIAPDRYAETQAGLARAPEVARRAIDRAKVQLSIGEFLANSSVRPEANADLLKFEVTNSVPAAARALTNAYAEAFTQYRTDLDTAQLRAAHAELQSRITQLRKSDQTNTELYRGLVQSAQQLRTMELLQTPNLVVRPAEDATHIEPTPTRSAILAGGLGLLLGIGLAFAWEALDKRVRTEEEIERRLELPMLTRIPAPPRHLEAKGRLAMLDEPQDAYAESIRRLRTNLEFTNIDFNAQMIMITSAVDREGKSTTIANLAVAFARSGRSVALVDLDLHRPVIAEFFGIEGRTGITDVVLGRRSIEEAITNVTLPGERALTVAGSGTTPGALAVVPSGTLPANPGEFIGTESLGRALAEIRKRADFVFIDAPPVLAVGDAMTLSARVDGIILVTRLGMVDKRNLADLSREFKASPARKLGFVVTGAPLKGGYGYGYRYGQGEDRPGTAVSEAGSPTPASVRPVSRSRRTLGGSADATAHATKASESRRGEGGARQH